MSSLFFNVTLQFISSGLATSLFVSNQSKFDVQ